MPSYAKLEQAMLSPDQLALVANSRSPAIAALDQDALYDLIARLEEALKSAHMAKTERSPLRICFRPPCAGHRRIAANVA